MTIAVTGSTGALGGLVARTLAEAGAPQRLLVRKANRAPALEGAEAFEVDYGNADAAASALRGIDTLFMVSTTENMNRLNEHRTFITAAVAAGVKHIVYTSFFEASPEATFTFARDHAATEEIIDQAGMRHTFLRDNFYQDILPSFVGDDDVLRGPGGDGSASFVARADIARTAAEILQHPEDHAYKTYNMTGPEALSLEQVAAVIADATGRPVRYHDESIDEARASRQAWNPPEWQMDAWISTYTAIARGELAAVSDDIERITGRPPATLAETVGAQVAATRG